MVPRQIIGIVYKTTNRGDGYNSGLLGLAFPGITSAHPGTVVDNTTFLTDRVPYDPLAFHMAKSDLIKPFFSLAIERTSFTTATGPGGYFGLGEVVPGPHSNQWARAPVVPLSQVSAAIAQNKTVYWVLDVNNVTWGPGSALSKDPTSIKVEMRPQLQINSITFNAILDNGNSVTYLPREVSEAINAQFSPPAIQTSGSFPSWVVDCNATAPSFGVEIGRYPTRISHITYFILILQCRPARYL